MLFNVPQYIDVEDKVAGPLTAKQLLWMIGLGAMLMFMWSIFDKVFFFILAIPVICIFVAFAFYRPYNQPLVVFIGSAIMYMVRPKIYVWNRPTQPQKANTIQTKDFEQPMVITKKVTADQLRNLANTVDNLK